MALSFLKRVVIVNQRLSLLYYGCMLTMFIILVSTFFGFEQYAKKVSMAGHVHVNIWPTGMTGPTAANRMLTVTQKNMQKPFCKQPHNFDYWWDANWMYVNHSCIPFCVLGVQGECFSSLDAFFAEAPDQVMLTTQVQKTFVPTVLGTAYPTTANYFIPGTEALGIGFAYNFDVPAEKVQTLGGIQNRILGSSQSLSGSSSDTIMTVLVDHDNKPLKASRPSTATLELTVPEMAAMAGNADLLDSVGSHPNALPGAAHGTGPLTRISGATLALEVNCYNSHREDIKHLLDGEWDGPTCYVGVKDANRWYPWSSMERREPAQDSNGVQGTRHLLFHGLRVVAKGDGILKILDVNNIYLNVVSYMVLMGLPKAFVLFIAVTLLGHFSKIYKGVIYDQFSIVEQVAGMSTRLMSNSVNFVDLEEGTHGEDGSGGIPQARMRERLREALRHRGGRLDDEEMESFINFCFRAVATNDEKNNVRFSKNMLLNALGAGSPEKEKEVKEHINIDCFNKACSSLDKISFEAVVKLFDRDRRVRPLERFFMPVYMRKYLSDVDHRRASSSQFMDLEQSGAHRQSGDASARTRAGDASVRTRAGDASVRTRNMSNPASLIDLLGFEKARAPADACSDTHSMDSSSDLQTALRRIQSGELTKDLGKHFEAFSKIVSDGQLEHLTVEQRKSLPQLMVHALKDVITREQATHYKVRDDARKLEEFESQLDELQHASTSQIPEQLRDVEQRVQGQMSVLREEVFNELAGHFKEQEHSHDQFDELRKPVTLLESSVEHLSKKLDANESELKACKDQLTHLMSAHSHSSAYSSEHSDLAALNPALRAESKQVNGSGLIACCSSRKPVAAKMKV